MILNKRFCDPVFGGEVAHNYEKQVNIQTGAYELITSPFKVLKFNSFLKDPDFISKLKSDIEQVELNRKNNDLYTLWQSDDLQNYGGLANLCQFIVMLKEDFGPFLEKALKLKFNNTFSVTASLYKHMDMLLCHDDKCDDRCVAFVYYLTGDGNEEEGAFGMFDHSEKNGQPTDIVRLIPPVKNSLLLFEVGNFTYHQVSEVTSQNFERLSINGWFHSDRKLNFLKYKEPFPDVVSQINESSSLSLLDDFINLSYLTPSVIVEAQKEFEMNSFILLKNYFVCNFFQCCLKELKRTNVWKIKGAPNRRKYEVLNTKSAFGSLDMLLKLLRSPSFVAYLRNMTGLDLIPLTEAEDIHSKLVVEVQRWTSGCYTMATDNDGFLEKPGLDVYLFFNSPVLLNPDSNGGLINYLAVDDDGDDDNELLNIDPEDNALIMVYRTSDTVKFTKYISHLIKDCYYCISATYFETDVIQ